MRTFIHHTAFAQAPRSYGVREFLLNIPEGSDITTVGNELFELTNNPSREEELEELQIRKSGQCYSTSVGDVIQIADTDEFAIITSNGFLAITQNEFSRLLNRWERELEDTPGSRWGVASEGLRYITAIRKLNQPPILNLTPKNGGDIRPIKPYNIKMLMLKDGGSEVTFVDQSEKLQVTETPDEIRNTLQEYPNSEGIIHRITFLNQEIPALP
jgi:hypothetical protein